MKEGDHEIARLSRNLHRQSRSRIAARIRNLQLGRWKRDPQHMPILSALEHLSPYAT